MRSAGAKTRAADPRPAATRAAIYTAVNQLVREPDVEITVNTIARRAGISRSAFYAQFSGLDALTIAMLVDAFRDLGADDAHEDGAGDVPGGRRGTLTRAALRRLVAHVAARQAFYRASLDWRVTSRAREVVVDTLAAQVRAATAAAAPAGVDADDVARFTAGGIMSLLIDWVRDPRVQWEQDGQIDVLVGRLLAVLPAWLLAPADHPILLRDDAEFARTAR